MELQERHAQTRLWVVPARCLALALRLLLITCLAPAVHFVLCPQEKFLTMAFGGPKNYSGRSLEIAHGQLIR